MYHAELILWLMAVLLLCWVASVLLRCASDGRHLRRYPAAAIPRRSAPWAIRAAGIGFVTALLATAGAIIFRSTVRFEHSSSSLTVMHAVGIGLWFASIAWISLWFMGDRGNFLPRCRRCWYELQPDPPVRCPECGSLHTTSRDLFRVRRPRWAAIGAGTTATLGTLTLLLAPTAARSGPLGLVPDLVLLRGWRYVPDTWLIGRDGSLLDRIGNDTIDPTAVTALTSRILVAMAQDPELRMNTAICDLIEHGGWKIVDRDPRGESAFLDDFIFHVPDSEIVWPVYIEALNDTRERLEFQISHPDAMYARSGTINVQTLRYWMAINAVRAEGSIPPGSSVFKEARSLRVIEKIQEETSRLLAEDQRIPLTPLNEQTDPLVAIDLSAYLDAVGARVSVAQLLRSAEATDGRMSSEHFPTLARSLDKADLKQQTAFYTTVATWLSSPEPRDASNAIRLANHLRYHSRLIGLEEPSVSSILIDAIAEHATTDLRSGYYSHTTISDEVNEFLSELDEYPEYSLAAFRRMISNASENFNAESCPRPRTPDKPDITLAFADAWLGNFTSLIFHPDEFVRDWVCQAFPTGPVFDHDPRFEAVLVQLESDDSLLVRTTAARKRQSRTDPTQSGQP